jgi:hypothetical protein
MMPDHGSEPACYGWRCGAVLGFLPALVVAAMAPIARMLVDATLEESMQQSSWLFLTAIAPERASYSPLLF